MAGDFPEFGLRSRKAERTAGNPDRKTPLSFPVGAGKDVGTGGPTWLGTPG